MTREELIARILQTDRTLRLEMIEELRTGELAVFDRNPNSEPGRLLANIRLELLRRDQEVPELPGGKRA